MDTCPLRHRGTRFAMIQSHSAFLTALTLAARLIVATCISPSLLPGFFASDWRVESGMVAPNLVWNRTLTQNHRGDCRSDLGS